MTKLSSKLPEDWDDNGIDRISGKLVREPTERHLIIAVVDCSKTEKDTDSGAVTPTARIRRLEAVQGIDREAVEEILRRTYEKRTGKESLPFASITINGTP